MSVFWLVIPSLPMFAVLPVLLRNRVHFIPAMAMVTVMTALLYLALLYVLKRFGVQL